MGLLITFEGIDGCGKTTHCKFIYSLLQDLSMSVEFVREPGNTKISEKIRDILLDANNEEMSDRSELLLYLAARAQVVDEVIAPALKQNKIVICDRFIDSTLCYQGYGRGLDINFINQANAFATNGIIPDLTLVFEAEKSAREQRVAKREEKDRLESENGSFFDKVYNAFDKLANIYPQRVKKIDSSGKHSVTAQNVIKTLSSYINFDNNKELIKTKLQGLDDEHAH